MLIVTPGADLKPLAHGAGYSDVLDVSGSIRGKLHTLANGVAQALGQMRPEDRFRLVTFNNSANAILPWTTATAENVRHAISLVKSLRASGDTNLYAGVAFGLKNLDPDRATSVVLVTDGVANQGIVRPADFYQLVKNKPSASSAFSQATAPTGRSSPHSPPCPMTTTSSACSFWPRAR